ncbi:AI-2E family transporter [Opitutaceae bacterium TAV3]|nr:AI-2E family transporter [Opitutaceae bacterium TAV3]
MSDLSSPSPKSPPPPPPPAQSGQIPSLLTPTQRRLVGFALGLLALIVSISLLAGVGITLSFVVRHFSSVLWPLAVAGILALILRPVVEFLESRLRFRRPIAVVALYAVFVLLVAAGLLVIIPPVVKQLIEFLSALPGLWEKAVAYVQEHSPQWLGMVHDKMANAKFQEIVQNLVSHVKTAAAEAVPSVESVVPSLKSAGIGVLGFFGFVTHLAIVPIYLFFFLLSRREPTRGLGSQLPFLKPGVRDDVVFLINEFIAIIISFFRGQLLIGLIMGVLLALGFSIIGLKFGLFIGLALGILNIVPYLGTILGLSVALPLALLQPDGGGVQLLVLVLVVFCVVQMIEGWFLTPKIMGDRTGLHPVAIIVAIFFWGTALDSILGMVLAIPLTAFFVTAWRLLKLKYLHRDDHDYHDNKASES